MLTSILSQQENLLKVHNSTREERSSLPTTSDQESHSIQEIKKMLTGIQNQQNNILKKTQSESTTQSLPTTDSMQEIKKMLTDIQTQQEIILKSQTERGVDLYGRRMSLPISETIEGETPRMIENKEFDILVDNMNTLNSRVESIPNKIKRMTEDMFKKQYEENRDLIETTGGSQITAQKKLLNEHKVELIELNNKTRKELLNLNNHNLTQFIDSLTDIKRNRTIS
eukprot:UN02828